MRDQFLGSKADDVAKDFSAAKARNVNIDTADGFGTQNELMCKTSDCLEGVGVPKKCPTGHPTCTLVSDRCTCVLVSGCQVT